MSKSVLIVQETLAPYRVPFFRRLHADLRDRGIHLDLAYGVQNGQPPAQPDLPWALGVRATTVGPFVWQPTWQRAWEADLVVVPQANRLLLNYALLAARKALGRPRIAFWGHGADLQGNPASVRERWKHLLLRSPDWWFAYTAGVADRIIASGFPRDHVTIVQNAVDTTALAATPRDKKPFRCAYVGRLYEQKRLPFLLEACDIVAENLPAFELVVIGDGPLSTWLGQQAATRPWLRLYPADHGRQRNELLATSQLLLMPGLVGLAIVDALAAAAPLVTTDDAPHSPEIEYLEAGANGVRLPAGTTPADYAHAVMALLSDASRLEHLASGCERSGRAITIEAMVANFAGGVEHALSTEWPGNRMDEPR